MTVRNTPGFESLLFRRQFFAGPEPVEFHESWVTIRIGDLFVSCHPDLAVASASGRDSELLVLGHVLDPAEVSSTTDEILRRVATVTDTFARLEVETSALGGRWLIFAKFGNELRLYPDAAGTKSAFYTVGSDAGDVWVASQPLLLAELHDLSIDQATVAEFTGSRYQNSWPGEVTPYANVRQLLPNHYLDLTFGVVHRFWPKGQIADFELEVAAERMQFVLAGSIASAGIRKKICMPLTGGYDSRTLFACAGELRKQIDFFTVVDPDTEYHDIAIPKKMTKEFDVKYRVLHTLSANDDFMEMYRRNTSYMISDPSNMKVYTYHGRFEDVFVLTGLMAEIARCFYHNHGHLPDRLDAVGLAALSGYAGNPVATASFANWLDDVPHDTNIDVLDLFFWEHRLGNWAAMMATGKDMVCEVIQPFNCRRLLQTALGVDVVARKEPYALFRRVLEMAAPETLSFPFNTTFVERALDRIKRVVPWRVQNFVFKRRMQMAGLSPSACRDGAIANSSKSVVPTPVRK